MKSIERISLVDRSKLSEEFYFTSLMEEAYNHGLLSDEDIRKIQTACLELIAYKTERYTSGDSSSVRVEVAQSIMKSNLYTIGLYLKTFPSPDDAVNVLLKTSILELYNCGRKRIDNLTKTAKSIHLAVQNNMIENDNYTYHSTVVDGIKGFFKIYDADFEAHEIHITADYPLCNPVDNYVGIEFVVRYLESVYLENMFCKYFNSESIKHLLYGFNEKYKDLVFNLFELVLTCAIGCYLVKSDITTLHISASQIEEIYFLLSEKSFDEAKSIVFNAYKGIVKELKLTNVNLEIYVEKALSTIVVSVVNAVKIDKLESVFIQAKSPEIKPDIIFSFGEKMDNEKYRSIINEIMLCDSISDKMDIINNIQSLADIEDLLFDAHLNSEETKAVLKKMEAVEIAALIKRHPYNPEIEAVDLSEAEMKLSLYLNEYFLKLPAEMQLLIKKYVSVINCDNEE